MADDRQQKLRNTHKTGKYERACHSSLRYNFWQLLTDFPNSVTTGTGTGLSSIT